MKAENLNKIIQLRHHLHMHPALSAHEDDTISTLENFLKENTSLEIVHRGKWFYALKKGEKQNQPIAFRADMDALPMEESIDIPWASMNPGTAHKCGHDGHMAALCGLALELDQLSLKRPVFLIFQHSEEIGEGGAKCAALIPEMGISEIYAFHNRSGYPENQIIIRRGCTQPASEGLIIHFSGKASHASAPEDGINPSKAVAELALYSHDLSSGSYEKMALCTIVGMHSGTDDFGISAGTGHICFTLRSESESVMKKMEQELIDRAALVSNRDGLKMTYEFKDRFPATCNHDNAVERVVDAAKTLDFPVNETSEMWRASEDFGHYLKKCSGAMFYIGNGENYPPLHTQFYDFNDRILETAVDMFLNLATSFKNTAAIKFPLEKRIPVNKDR